MTGRTLTQSELLSIWERGEGQRPSRRTLALLEGATRDADAKALAAMPIGRRDAALLDLREQLFGDEFSGITTCPACAEEIELSFDASEVRFDGSTAPIVFEGDRYVVEMRLPSTADLAAIERLDDLSVAREELFVRCVVQATHDGAAIDPHALPAHVVDAIAQRMAVADPQADVQLDAGCPTCGHEWREPFDIVTFLFTELSAFARRLLSEVHELARGYGWSERDILSLTPTRRTAYLEMLR